MPNLTEHEIVSKFIGLPINAEALKKCGRKNGADKDPAEYIVYSCGYLYNPDLREQFGITDKLKDQWERRGTEFDIYLYIADGCLVSARVFKYSESGGPRPSMSTPGCTQQELRIARRILEYVTR